MEIDEDGARLAAGRGRTALHQGSHAPPALASGRAERSARRRQPLEGNRDVDGRWPSCPLATMSGSALPAVVVRQVLLGRFWLAPQSTLVPASVWSSVVSFLLHADGRAPLAARDLRARRRLRGGWAGHLARGRL